VDGVERRWRFEEFPGNPDAFYILDGVKAGKTVTAGFLAYRTAYQRQDNTNMGLDVPGLNLFCVDNTEGWDLDVFLQRAMASKQLQVTEETEEQWGEVEVVGVGLKDTNPGGIFDERAYLAVSDDGDKLLLMRLFPVDDEDSTEEQLLLDMRVIEEGLKYQE